MIVENWFWIVVYCGFFYEVLENMLVVYEMVLNIGVEMVECDVYFSSDGVVVLFYDDMLDWMTNGMGFVSDKSLVEL